MSNTDDDIQKGYGFGYYDGEKICMITGKCAWCGKSGDDASSSPK